MYLADTSAWHRSRSAFFRWSELMGDGEIATCAPVRLELLYSARSARDYETLSDRLDGLPQLALVEPASAVALRAQRALAASSHHRGPTPVDLLVAAVAEVNGAVLLHYDRHFDAIRRVTGQPMEWLAKRGTIP